MVAPRVFPLLAAVLLGAVAAAGDGGRKSAPNPARTPEEWVKRLGSESYRVREEATRRLLQMEEAYEALQRARRSADPEVRRRATLILGTLKERVEEQAAWQLLSEVRPGQVERLIGQLTGGKGRPAEEHWQEVVRLARTLAARASRIRGAAFEVPGRGAEKMEVVRACPPAGLWGKRVLVAGIDHDVASLSNCLLVSAGPVKRVDRVRGCVVLVNGNVAGCSMVQDSLLICRGNVGDVAAIDGSVLLIKGRLGAVVSAEDSLFQARELGRFTSSRNNIFLNRKDVAATFPGADRFLQAGQKE